MTDVTRGASTAVAKEIATAVVLTALDIEAMAVTAHLGDLDEETTSDNTIVCDCGTFEGLNVRWRVAVAECGPGNIPTTHIAIKTITHFVPDVILFVGVAGGLKDVDLGDVVAGSKVYGYHSGKDAGSFEPRPVLEWADVSLEQRARAVCRRGDWIGRIKREGYETVPNLKAIVRPIAAGEQVVASGKAATYNFIRQAYGDAVTVEMEGYGFLSAARVGRTPAIVIRGVSDLCEGKSDRDAEGWQPRAAAHAAAFAFELLARFEPPPRFLRRESHREPAAEPVAPGPNAAIPDAKSLQGSPIDEPASLTSQTIESTLLRVGTRLIAKAVPADAWIPREAEVLLDQKLADPDCRVICLLGEAGSGKTALLARLTARLIERGQITIAFKADLAPPSAPFEDWLQHQLDLPIQPIDAIQRLAENQPVYVVIDQIDALADLVDLQSQRLNDVLEFIDACAGVANVRVICSCRAFEYRHDVRLTSIGAEEVFLELPGWDEVASQLDKRGVLGSANWGPQFRELLRSPLILKLFTDLGGAISANDVFQSYQQVFDEFWRRRVNTEERRDLLYKLTADLITRETLWAPEARFESDAVVIAELLSDGVLARHARQIGFSHQALLEYAKARLFTRHGQSLAEHVLARQDAILVRPTLWYVLQYLRDADPQKYADELNALFAAELRLHVRYLLIDFMGRQSSPLEIEIVHMAARLKDADDRIRVLLAIRNKEQWFRLLKDSHLPVVLSSGRDAAGAMAQVLAGAWSFCRDECLDLLRRGWLNDPAMDEYSIYALRSLESWDDGAVELVCRLIARSDGERLWWAEDLTSLISEHAPRLAPRVVRAALKRTATVREQIREDPNAGPHGRHRGSPLDWGNEWHDLPAIAEAAPVQFLEEIWPLFVEWALEYHGGHPGSVLRAYGGSSMAFEARDWGFERPIAISLLSAIEKTAELEPSRFIEITRPAWTVENGVVQGLIAHGLAANPAATAHIALKFLCSDARRFILGDYESGEQHYSTSLIEAIAPYLNDGERQLLEQSIVTWSKYLETDDRHGDQITWDREARLRLLRAIPEDLLSPPVADLARQEEDELPSWRHERLRQSRAGLVKEIPPLTKDEMASATDEVVLDSLRGPEEPDRSKREWVETEDGWVEPGGARAAARELAELSKEDPDRVIPILRKAMAAGLESAVGESLRSMIEAPIADDRVFDLVLDLSAGRSPGEEFRSDASFLLYRRCRSGVGLPDRMCELLESWLALPWNSQYGAFVSDQQERRARAAVDHPQSVLWAPGGGIIDSDRSFWTLEAVTYGYLMQEPPKPDRWLGVLERHVERDISERTWRSFCHAFRWINLKGSDQERGARVVERLFSRLPSVAFSDEGVAVVARIGFLLRPGYLEAYLNALRASPDSIHVQAYGELVTLLALRDKDRTIAGQVLDEELARIEELDPTTRETVLTGIAFAAARLWDEPAARVRAGGLLRVAATYATPSVAYAFGTVFMAESDFADDEETEKLLLTVAANPAVVSQHFVNDLVDHVAKLCRYQRRTALAVARAIVDTFGGAVGSIASALYSAGAHLVDIAMTLQRFHDTRSDGLALLEDLMRRGVGDAFAALQEIDLRPDAGAPSANLPRRQRRRRRRSAAS